MTKNPSLTACLQIVTIIHWTNRRFIVIVFARDETAMNSLSIARGLSVFTATKRLIYFAQKKSTQEDIHVVSCEPIDGPRLDIIHAQTNDGIHWFISKQSLEEDPSIKPPPKVVHHVFTSIGLLLPERFSIITLKGRTKNYDGYPRIGVYNSDKDSLNFVSFVSQRVQYRFLKQARFWHKLKVEVMPDGNPTWSDSSDFPFGRAEGIRNWWS